MSFFELEKYDAAVTNEAFCGITVFLTMSYILTVNPVMLSEAGMPFGHAWGRHRQISPFLYVVVAGYGVLMLIRTMLKI